MADKPNGAEAHISVPEICQRLEVQKSDVYYLLKTKEIAGIKVRGRWVIPRHAYEEWESKIEENKRLAMERLDAWNEQKRRELGLAPAMAIFLKGGKPN